MWGNCFDLLTSYNHQTANFKTVELWSNKKDHKRLQQDANKKKRTTPV